jgi:hypothetical protein
MEGILLGVSYTPWFRGEGETVKRVKKRGPVIGPHFYT